MSVGYVYRYVCQDDACGLIFRYSDGAHQQPSLPRYCPCCGKHQTVTVDTESSELADLEKRVEALERDKAVQP